MKAFIQVDPDGNIKSLARCGDDDLIPEDAILIEDDSGISSWTHHYDHETEAVVAYSDAQMSARRAPRPGHRWSPAVGWVDERAVEARKAEKAAAIAAERERRNELPIPYAGSLFDADAKAQRNVSAWMVSVASGVPVPPGFSWRDHENTDHPADAAFIVGLGGAITVRGTQLYQTSWQKKAALASMTTAVEVDEFDPLADW
jgi:hypothetical protein